MTVDTILVDRTSKIASITLNRPDRLNALDEAMLHRLPQIIRGLSDQDVRAFILQGAGGRAFASGGDLGQVGTMNSQTARRHAELFEQCLRAVEDSPIPSIAKIDGYALGGGLELAAACDFRVAAPGSRFGIPVAKLGHTVDLANARRLVRLIGMAQIKPLVLLDHLLDSSEAKQIGIVHWIVPREQLDVFTLSVADTLAAKAPLSIAASKRTLQWIADHPPEDDGQEISRFSASLYDSSDFREGVAAFVEKRSPTFTGR